MTNQSVKKEARMKIGRRPAHCEASSGLSLVSGTRRKKEPTRPNTPFYVNFKVKENKKSQRASH